MFSFLSKKAFFAKSHDFSNKIQRFISQKPFVNTRPIIFSKDNISLRIRPLKGKYMVQERNITLGDEGCLIFDFVDQMKDHEGAVQVNYNSRIPFRVNLSEIHKFFEIDPYFNREKNIEIEYKKTLTGERKKLSFVYDKEKNSFLCELKVNEPAKNSQIEKKMLLTENDMYFIQELIRAALPYMNGWYAIASLALIKTDLMENKEQLKKQLELLDNNRNEPEKAEDF